MVVAREGGRCGEGPVGLVGEAGAMVTVEVGLKGSGGGEDGVRPCLCTVCNALVV